MSIVLHPSTEALLEKLYNPDHPPMIMGIINATPDSFFRGSRANGVAALGRALEYISQGADMLDVGGESTRPGALDISTEEELERVIPVIRSIRRESDIPVSIDTRKALVAQEALAAGANCINDISALRFDPEMAGLIAEQGVPVILMHMQGSPRTMQQAPAYHDVTGEVIEFLKERIDYAVGMGIPCEKIIIDPGIGFGKSLAHNLQLLKNLDRIAGLGYPLLMGHSRKSFIGRILADGEEQEPLPPEQRLFGSLGVLADSYMRGARIFRVHDVAESRELLQIMHTIRIQPD